MMIYGKLPFFFSFQVSSAFVMLNSVKWELIWMYIERDDTFHLQCIGKGAFEIFVRLIFLQQILFPPTGMDRKFITLWPVHFIQILSKNKPTRYFNLQKR